MTQTRDTRPYGPVMSLARRKPPRPPGAPRPRSGSTWDRQVSWLPGHGLMHLAFPVRQDQWLNEAPAIRLQLRGQHRLCEVAPAHRFPILIPSPGTRLTRAVIG